MGMAFAEGGVRYTPAHALTPKTPRARTSTPTTSRAAITRALAPPGNFLSLDSVPRFENCQTKNAKRSCAARKEIPASAMVSDICSSIRCPCVEISAGASHVCIKIGIADRIAMTMIVIAKNLPIIPHLCPYEGRFIAIGALAKTADQEDVPRSPTSIGLRLEDEVDGLGFAAADGHFLRLIAVGFLPRG